MGRVEQGVFLPSRFQVLLVFFCACASVACTGAERTITAVDLFDRMRGMWLGQLIGNAAGRPTEGLYSSAEPNPAESVPWQIRLVWDADDDTDIEYVALHSLLMAGFDCNSAEIAGEWLDHITDKGIYVANKQAWRLMLDGHLPPETGSRTFNEHWYSIDAQISTEVLGAVSPGLPQMAIDLAGRFGRISNDGLAVHAAQVYAAMYAEAFFEPNVVELVRKGLEAIPASSRTSRVISDVLDWYLQDAADGVLDWRATRRKLYDNYEGAGSFSRYYNWVESTINAGATILALLYGQGDFKRTVQIAVLEGWDCDCNPATAGGLLGIMHGFSGLPADLTDPTICGNTYLNSSRPGLPDPAAPLPQADAVTTVALYMLVLAEENILRSGGSYTSNEWTRVYSIPALEGLVREVEKPDSNGPGGLVGEALAAGIAVTPRGSVSSYDESRDRYNLYSIMDSVTDNSYNGRKPYSTYVADAATRPDKDWYELAFSQPVVFTGVTFYEGDIVWNKMNTYYADDEPLGGFFEDLTVQVLRDGEYIEPNGVQVSAELDRLQMYQVVTFTFAPTAGDAVRVIGTPGGSKRFATILELEAHGELIADTLGGPISAGDLEAPLSDDSPDDTP